MSRLYIGSINKAKEIIREEFPKAKASEITKKLNKAWKEMSKKEQKTWM